MNQVKAKSYIENLTARVDQYFTVKKQKKLTSCRNNSDCSQFLGNDNRLSDIANNIKSIFKPANEYYFGVASTAVYDSRSDLRKKCGSCCGSISFSDRNRARAEAENYISSWNQKAKLWLNQGAPEMDSRQVKRFKSSVKKKNPFI